jgi:hypothetical protein
MPSQDDTHAPDPEGRGLSRRSLLYGATTAGAVGLAATAMGAGPALAAATQGQAHGAPATAEGAQGPIVVHVRDTRSGDIEVFHGTSQSRLRDTDLAARIARAVG